MIGRVVGVRLVAVSSLASVLGEPHAAAAGRPKLYIVSIDDDAQHQVNTLPAAALAMYAGARTTLEVAPWAGVAYNQAKPDSPMRQLVFGDGQGMITYLIVELEDRRRVDVLRVWWAG